MEVVISVEPLYCCCELIVFPTDFALHIIICVFVQLHIVNKRKDLTLTQAVETHNGLAVLGFFIEVT